MSRQKLKPFMSDVTSKELFEFADNNGDQIYLLDFYSSTCAPCQVMFKILDRYHELYPDFPIYKVHAQSEHELAVRFEIMSVPSLFLCQGREILHAFHGVTALSDLERIIKDVQDPYFKEHGKLKSEAASSKFFMISIVVTISILLLIAFFATT